MCGNPHDGGGRGEHVLSAMKALSPNLREELVELWDAVIPKLLAYLSGEPVRLPFESTPVFN